MDQQKIGRFLKELRKEKGATQEQAAEMFHVSNRTVSRWENGYHMPDLDVLIEIADYYRVDLRELLDGERKGKNMDKETKEIVLKAVDYTNGTAEHCNNRVRWLFCIGAILFVASQVISHTALDESAILHTVSDFAAGAACGTMIVGIVVAGRFGKRLNAFKQRMAERNR